MTLPALALLNELRALDVQLRVESGRLRVNAPKGRLTPELEATLVANKAVLIELLSGEAADVELRPAAPGDTIPLSFLQERLWLLSKLSPADTGYNFAWLAPFDPTLDVGRMVSALRRVIDRHDILRSRYVLHGPTPVVELASPERTPIDVRDLRALSDAEQDAILDEAAARAAREPFDLMAEAPVRFAVLRTGDVGGAVLCSVHHIALDAWSVDLLRAEIAIEYAGGDAAPLRARPSLQYGDFALWQTRTIATGRAQHSLQYWTTRLAGLPTLCTLPPDHPRRRDVAGDGRTIRFALPADALRDAHATGRDLQVTIYMMLVAAAAVVLSRTAQQTDITIGSPIGTRERPELDAMIGPIVNPVVLRLDLSDDPTFAQLVARTRDAVLDGHEHQHLPFESIVQALNPPRTFGQSPLFQVAMVMHSGSETVAPTLVGGGAIHDLTIFTRDNGTTLTGAVEYRSDLYDESTITRFAAQLCAVLSAGVADTSHRVSSMPMQSAADAVALLARVNPPPSSGANPSILAAFAAQAARMPTAIAIDAADGQLTYAELDRRSARLATQLRRNGAGAGRVVAIAIERSAAMLVGVLGILRSGAAYQPIDVSYPAARLSFELADSGATQIVTTASALKALAAVTLPTSIILLGAPDASDAGTGAEALDVGPRDPAYVIYTSGSSGTPKGVLIPHAALANFVVAMRERLDVGDSDAFLAATSLSFDISVLELLLPLAIGGRVIIATRDDTTDGVRLATLLRRTTPSVLQFTPSGWRLLMHAAWEGRVATAISGGESMPDDLAQWLCARAGRAWNGYGPTETTVYSTMARITTGAPVTIGTPIANTRVYLLDAARSEVPVGVPAEICIAGAGVALGYLNQDALTAECFVDDPYVAGARLYRTGDIGRWREDGQLEHLGRADGQVKVRGYRIETVEIESALATHPMVRAAAVGVREAAAGDVRLVAWVQLTEDDACTATELRRHLRDRLPEFMIPSMVVLMSAFPLTGSNKVDRRALPDPFTDAASAIAPRLAPSTPMELIVAEVWANLLGAVAIGVGDTFFDLGGHSLLAMLAARELGVRTGAVVEPRLLYFRTLGQIADFCASTQSAIRAEA